MSQDVHREAAKGLLRGMCREKPYSRTAVVDIKERMDAAGYPLSHHQLGRLIKEVYPGAVRKNTHISGHGADQVRQYAYHHLELAEA